jgi:hypothetical protein
MNHFFIKVLRFVVNAAWYLILPLMLMVMIAVVYKINTKHYLDIDIPVYVKDISKLPALQLKSEFCEFTGIKQADAVLQFKAKPTFMVIVVAAFSLACSVLPLIGILYQFRKILNSLKADVPFSYENIRRLRLISLFILLFAVGKLFGDLSNLFFFNQLFSGIDTAYLPKVAFGFLQVMGSIIVFMLSEIFRQGYKLKMDNESFI